MRTESFKRGFIPILFALALSMAFAPALIYPQIGPGSWTVEVIVDNVVYHHHPYPDGPQRETPKVVQGGTFIIRCKSSWTEPEYDGAYTVTLAWDCYDNHENENFTFVGASAYFTTGPHAGESIQADVTMAWAPSGSDTRYALSVKRPADNKDNRDGDFNVDITMSASGAGGVPHIPTDNNAIISIGLVLVESATWFTEVDPITIEVLPGQPGVKVDISPTSQEGVPLATLTYNVTVTNTGTVDDNYGLTVSDNENWGPTLSETLLDNVGPGENRVITLSVTIPENATSFDEDDIWVTATSVENAEVTDSEVCIAQVPGKAIFGLVKIYEISLDADLYLGQGSKLVVKFYTWGDAFQGETVVWSGTTPDHVILLEDILHPHQPLVWVWVEKVVLVLTDAEGTTISTFSTFIVRKVDLEIRFMEIPLEWVLNPSDNQIILEQEFMDLPSQWVIAPS